MKYMVNPKPSIDNIGNAIREKLNTSTTYTIDQMPDAIRSIGGSGESSSGGTHTVNFSLETDYNGDGGSIDEYGFYYNPFISAQDSETAIAKFDEVIEYFAAGYQVEISLYDHYANQTHYGVVTQIFDHSDSPGIYTCIDSWNSKEYEVSGEGFIAMIHLTNGAGSYINFPLVATKGMVVGRGGT